jgi:hypothetical protein
VATQKQVKGYQAFEDNGSAHVVLTAPVDSHNYIWNPLTLSWEPRQAESAGDTDIVYDEASATIAYLGKAAPGSATSSAVWQIKRFDFTSGVVGRFAGGTADFDKIWDNRTSLSYP